MKKNNCKGCLRNKKRDCFLSDKDKDCPCSICLLKGICTDVCHNFLDYVFLYNKPLHNLCINKNMTDNIKWKR